MLTLSSHDHFEPLACSSIVYRLIRSKRWIDRATHKVLPDAYIRRPNDTDGLSVNLASACTIEEARTKLRECHGIASLHVGRVRDIGLDVKQDSIDHANIIGVPSSADHPKEIEHIARLLAKQSRIQWLP